MEGNSRGLDLLQMVCFKSSVFINTGKGDLLLEKSGNRH